MSVALSNLSTLFKCMRVTSSKVENLKTDVVVLGGGGAGLCAAVQAAEDGVNVIVVEKRNNAGGNTALAHEFFAVESSAQQRQSISTSRDEFFKYAMEWHHWKVNPRIVRAYINKSGDTCRWLEEKGLEITSVSAPSAPGFFSVGHHATGASIIKVLTKQCDKLGIKVLCQTPAKKLLSDGTGSITGVIATSSDREYQIEAKGVIITTGGYGANKRLLKKYCPADSEGISYSGVPGLTGDGLKMAIEIGAATEGLGLFHYGGPRFVGLRLVGSVNRHPEAIWVNRDGERYCDECVAFDIGTRGNTIDRQPGKISFTIFDEQIKNNIIEENLNATKPVGFITGVNWADMTKELQLEANRGSIKISDSWVDIAGWMGANHEVLKATIDEYNSSCDQKYDEIFLKDSKYLKPLRTPPYYAVKCYQGLMDTMGGIKVNHCMEVIDKNGKPVPGLYAGGVCAGGFESETYCYHLTGSMLSFALNSGRMAGETAASYAKGR